MTAHFDATRLAEKASNLHREQKGPTKGDPTPFCHSAVPKALSESPGRMKRYHVECSSATHKCYTADNQPTTP